MTEAKANTALTWARAAGTHLALVALSLFFSYLLIRRVGLMPGEVLDFIACVYLASHVIAAVVGLLFRRASVRSCALVFAIAFFPGCVDGVSEIQKAIHLNYFAPYDRFRENVASPVPNSVSNLRFLPLDEQIRPDGMFEFDIDPVDLDTILANLKLKRVDPTKMLNPKDYFQYPFYLPVGGAYHVFQGTDRFDEVLTIKANESHTHAVFRRESSGFYRDRGWENGNPTIVRMEEEALERLKRKYSD